MAVQRLEHCVVAEPVAPVLAVLYALLAWMYRRRLSLRV
jgi:hypothetical protein